MLTSWLLQFITAQSWAGPAHVPQQLLGWILRILSCPTQLLVSKRGLLTAFRSLPLLLSLFVLHLQICFNHMLWHFSLWKHLNWKKRRLETFTNKMLNACLLISIHQYHTWWKSSPFTYNLLSVYWAWGTHNPHHITEFSLSQSVTSKRKHSLITYYIHTY